MPISKLSFKDFYDNCVLFFKKEKNIFLNVFEYITQFMPIVSV